MAVEATENIILLVDDNPTNLGVLFDSLGDSGFKMLVAQDGESAIAQVNYIKPDIILLDVMMPGIDGFETCRRLKENPETQNIPIIFMTALTDTVDKVRGFSMGAVDYVTKPIQSEEVLARITAHLSIQTLQKRLHQQNQQLQQEILERERALRERQQAEQALRVLLHAVSHDLRNPVTGMLMVLNNLLKAPHRASDETDQVTVPRSILERMVQSGDRQLNLINSLLEAHTCESQGVALHTQPLQLHSLTTKVAQDLEPLLTKNQATLIDQVPPDLPNIEADPNQLWRVFENLIGNALKHNAPGIELVVKAIAEPTQIHCSVEDNGVGIAPEQSAQLFDLYQRGINARHTHGLGLGLYLCRQIIAAHGGEIGVVSNPQGGAKFWFTLPRSPLTPKISETPIAEVAL
jgi:two-component system, sensor histidine kinase and response regulator